jgi:hypothetical protein
VLDGHTLGEFYAVWLGGGTVRRSHDPDAVRDKINRLRAAKGLPPMKAAPQGKPR